MIFLTISTRADGRSHRSVRMTLPLSSRASVVRVGGAEYAIVSLTSRCCHVRDVNDGVRGDLTLMNCVPGAGS